MYWRRSAFNEVNDWALYLTFFFQAAMTGIGTIVVQNLQLRRIAKKVGTRNTARNHAKYVPNLLHIYLFIHWNKKKMIGQLDWRQQWLPVFRSYPRHLSTFMKKAIYLLFSFCVFFFHFLAHLFLLVTLTQMVHFLAVCFISPVREMKQTRCV